MTSPILSIRVHGDPAPEQRHRTGRGRHHHDSRPDRWKGDIRLAALEALGIEGSLGPAGKRKIWVPEGSRCPVFPAGAAVALGVTFWLERPVSHFKGGRRKFRPEHRSELKSTAPMHPVGKPDLDNLIKSVKDALGDWLHRGAIAWVDDAQVISYRPFPAKRFDDIDTPGCLIQLFPG